jgi:hypothetical protein
MFHVEQFEDYAKNPQIMTPPTPIHDTFPVVFTESQ